MTSLTENQKSFIRLMSKSPEHGRRGFELLLKRDDFDTFFDALAAEGLFEPTLNPAPIEIEPGSVRIPYWAALDYLFACAKRANQKSDIALARKVMIVVRAVSTFREQGVGVRDNHHTFRKFAEILGALPTQVPSIDDVALAAVWLSSRFDQDMVGHALDEGAIKGFLASDVPENWEKAVQLLRYCTEVRWESGKRRGLDEDELVATVDEYWLRELISHHAKTFGIRAGQQGAVIFRERVHEIFSKGGRASWSCRYRPAVENHGQNRSWREAENCFVEGLRDIVLSWCDVDAAGAKPFANELLHSDVAMLRRIGIFVLGERWPALHDLYKEIVGPELFAADHIHELYGLLRSHFEQFGAAEKALTLEAIRNIQPAQSDEPALSLKRVQRRWLSAIAGTTYGPAARWLAELEANPKVGLPEHPDFNSYVESSWGPGSSPYEVEELVGFVEQRRIGERLGAFKESARWRAPSVEALAQTLERAVIAAPRTFSRALSQFTDVAPVYQNAVLSGFRRLWDAKGDPPPLDWDVTWTRLVQFARELLENPRYGSASEDTRDSAEDWVLSTIADLLQAGTRDDDHAYTPTLLPNAWELLQILLDRAKGMGSPGEDPMTQSINTPRGRALEAVFGHALRECRLADKATGSHAEQGARIEPVFERELQKYEHANYEFATLAGAYLANLQYMNSKWLGANIKRLFPPERPVHLICAVAGMAYSAATRGTFLMLRDAGVLDAALRLNVKGRETRKTLIEWITLGYLWNEDALDSSRFTYLFTNARIDDLESASWFVWSIRRERLSEEQLARVVDLWERCVVFSGGLPSPPAKLLSSLSGLSFALKDATGRNRDLLLTVAPYVRFDHSTHEFLGELLRLVERSPIEVSDVLRTLIESYEPTYDYQDRMKLLVRRLAELGQRPAALEFCNKLRNLSGMADLYAALTAAH